jgi:hypothetical protein
MEKGAKPYPTSDGDWDASQAAPRSSDESFLHANLRAVVAGAGGGES